LLLSTSLTGLISGFIMQKIQKPTSKADASEPVLTTLQPELKPVPEPVTSLFLYNTLHNISALLLFDVNLASAAAENLANFVRAVTEIKKARHTSLGEEFKAVDLYLTIEKSRLGDRLVIEKNFSRQCYEIPFPSLALFPFIDGCIRYSAELQTNPVTVTIACQQENNALILELADHVQESEEETWPQASRDAVYTQLRRRLLDFYGSSARMSRQPLQPTGERLKITIPLANAKIGRTGRQEAA
ncbi:histidine kinase, partial [candidate division KSB1 bacterium]|nr:histidine kinase [candidate division KSB1 bacterium]